MSLSHCCASICLGLGLAVAPVAAQSESADTVWEGAVGFGAGAVVGVFVGTGYVVGQALLLDEAVYGYEVFRLMSPFAAVGAALGAIYGSAQPEELSETMAIGFGGWLAGGLIGYGGAALFDPDRKLGWATLSGAVGLLGATIVKVADADAPDSDFATTFVTLVRLAVP